MKCMALAEVADGGGLGDLEADALGGDAGGLDLGQHVVEEGVVAHRLAREVDGEAGGRRRGERVPQASATKAAWTTQRSIEAIRW